ncbi:hypothetical protein evm_008034 [Chilo suppressalis]|nr:hypothetical protein evm_008034 [Chilo suppressalis]
MMGALKGIGLDFRDRRIINKLYNNQETIIEIGNERGKALIMQGLLDLGWWYFFAKFTELLDTVFFVLRKKNNQVTFLHVYHHVIMALYSWSYLKFAAGGEGAILALLNSMVHVFMYTYYLLSGFGPRFQKYLWWKKYVTTMQLIQFVMMLFYCAWTHFSPRCQYNSSFTYFISGNITIFLFLFLNFYSKSYKGKKDIKKEIKEEYNKTRNGIKTDDATKLINAVTQNGKSEENGFHRNNVNNTNGVGDNIKLKNSSEDYSKDGKMLLTRRTLNGTVEQQYDFGSVIKK